jgi:hypothetical protein
MHLMAVETRNLILAVRRVNIVPQLGSSQAVTGKTHLDRRGDHASTKAD